MMKALSYSVDEDMIYI